MENKSIYAKLIEIQSEMKVPKNLYNKFGGFNYRNGESILEAAKPICKKHGVTLYLSDEIELIGDRFYVKATATLTDGNEFVSTHAYAREVESKKGMDGSQVTGVASSYARKYALNGLFNLDDNKDADSNEYANLTSRERPEGQYLPEKQEPEKVICPQCGKVVHGVTNKKGKYWSPNDILRKYKMCGDCYKKSKSTQEVSE